jgi:hypothetical protein
MINYITHCPICDLEWKRVEGSEWRFKCPNFDICKFTFMNNGARLFLCKKYATLTEIWWIFSADYSGAEARIANKNIKLSFMPPFDIDEDKLKLYLTFS